MASSLAPQPSDDAGQNRSSNAAGFDRVLFHVSSWQDARASVPWVARVTRPGGQVVLVHFWDERESWRRGKWDAEPEREARALLSSLRSAVEEVGLDARTELVPSQSHELAHCLRHAATRWQADLAVIGLSHSRQLWLGLAPSTEDLTRGCHLPILCMPARPHRLPPPGSVLLAVGVGGDGSALSAMLALIRSRTFMAHVLHVCPIVQSQGGCYVEPEDAAWTRVREVLASLRDAGIKADGWVTTGHGRVADEIMASAHRSGVGLIVIGGRAPAFGPLRWGTVHDLLRISDRPVLVGRRAS
jgi:nucleotide-binding universal stress UspA family protein